MKRIFAFVIAISFLLALTSCRQSGNDYKSKLISVMSDTGTTTVGEIFDFEFDRAYIFTYADGYISGAGFAERYNLDISIHQVESSPTDNIQRIVFVDQEGNFVYLFKCMISDAYFAETGIVIYPETTIERVSSKERLTIHFDSLERYAPEIAY